MTMKKILLTLITTFSLTLFARAGEGDLFFNIHAGTFYQKTLNGILEMEFEKKYNHSWNIYFDFSNKVKYCDIDKTYFCEETFWDYQTAAVGIAYKHELIRWRNANFKARLGVDLGTDYCKKDDYSFYMSAEVGFELSYSFKSRWQLCIMQKNDFCFFTRDHFKNGLLVGVKIPLN